MSKKLLSILAVGAISIGLLAGCGGSDSADKSSSSQNTTATQESNKSEEKTEAKKDTQSEENQVIQVPVTIVNNTDVDFYELYTSGAGTDDWGDDLLGGQVLSPNTQLQDIAFNIDADNLKWDLLAKDEAGDALEFYGLDLSECSTDGITISLTYDRDTQTGTITAE
ncbi:hypothetical protein [uncultured Clostridium sp.]|uniref:hypothetical protein n=1 Tax=uncultured Clostridium sp. TaxID=59620 RepID=UPI0025D8B1F7|nr:hypothetical protein [uncultured Clostridium sp.]